MPFRPMVAKRSHEQWSLKPQDFLLGLAIALSIQKPVSNDQLGLTLSGFRDSMARLKAARLVSEFDGALHLALPAFRPFAVYAAPFCWPAVVGETARGHRTAFSDSDDFPSQQGQIFVWPDENGECVGKAIIPLHQAVPGAARRNASLGQALNLFDVLRVKSGSARDIALSQIQSLLTA